jgi:hypothetical protein
MTVSELIAELQKIDGDRTVILSMDPEGNAYNPLDESWLIGAYGNGEAGLERLTDEDRKAGYDKDDVIDGLPALILYPKAKSQ